MARLLLIYFYIIFPIAVFAQSEEPHTHDAASVAMEFIHDLADENMALDVILSTSVTVNNPTDELYDYLEVSLEEIRLNLSTKNLELLELKNYHELSRREVSDIDPEELNVDNMYFLYHNRRLVTSLYIQEGKVASFTLVSKGNNRAHFVTY